MPVTARLSRQFYEHFGDDEDTKSDLMRWMFIYWSSLMLSLGGLVVVLLRR